MRKSFAAGEIGWAMLWAAVCLGTTALAGCGGKDAKPISAATSKHKAVDEGDEAASDAGKTGGGASKTAEGSGETKTAKSTPGGASEKSASGDSQESGPRAPAAGPVREKPGASDTTASAAGKSPGLPGKNTGSEGSEAGPAIDLFSPPKEATLADLSKYITALKQRLQAGKIPGKSKEEMQQNAQRMVLAMHAASERGLELATKAGDEKQRYAMFQEMYETVHVLGEELGDDSKQQPLLDLVSKLRDDKNPDLAGISRIIEMGPMLAALQSNKPTDLEKFAKSLAGLVELAPASSAAAGFLGEGIETLQRKGRGEDASRLLRAMAEAYQKSSDPKVAERAGDFTAEAKLIDSKITDHAQALLGGKAEAGAAMLSAAETLLAGPPPAALLFTQLESVGRALESQGQGEPAGKLFELLGKTFATSSDKNVAEAAGRLVECFKKRSTLIGKPLAISGVSESGEAFDPAKLKGHVVLVWFFEPNNPQSQASAREVSTFWQLYRSKGLEVAAIALTPATEEMKSSQGVFPWKLVFAPSEAAGGFKHPTAVAAGVDVAPTMLLIDAEGKVAATQISGRKLMEELSRQLGPIDPAVLGGPRGTPRNVRPPGGAPGGQPAPRPESGDGSRVSPRRDAAENGAFVAIGATETAAEKEGEKPAAGGKVQDKPAKNPAEKKPAEKKPEEKPAAEVNPYLADAGLSSDDLATFILDMREKPRPIQERPGYVAAILDAAERLLADPKAPPKLQWIAIEARFDILHQRACAGDDESQKKLTEVVASLAADPRPEVAARVRFYQLEARALGAEKLPLEKIPQLLTDIKTFCGKETLEEPHLRLASLAVKAINRLESGDEREKQFAELGKVLSKSSYKRLAKYGKALANPEGEQSDLVGKPLELAGTTSKGDAFDWQKYRGKVVIVDFWATWCGPCRAEMPHVKETYEKHHARGLEIVGVSLDMDEEALTKYLEENEIPWPNLAGEANSALAEKYGVHGIPTLMLVDREGKVAAVGHSVSDFSSQLEKLLAAKK